MIALFLVIPEQGQGLVSGRFLLLGFDRQTVEGARTRSGPHPGGAYTQGLGQRQLTWFRRLQK
jgi:hypothetical protein